MSSTTTLRQLLGIFETAAGPLSLPRIARELNVSPERLDMMLQHWVRKGKIRECASPTECGTCGQGASCPFVLDLPRSYELVRPGVDAISLEMVGVACGR